LSYPINFKAVTIIGLAIFARQESDIFLSGEIEIDEGSLKGKAKV